MATATRLALLSFSCLLASSCTADVGDPYETGGIAQPLTAFCTVDVVGKGIKDVENDYLPRVITCENGGADLQALKAQAIAARSYLYYKLETSGSITDGQGDQVYTCNAQPQDKHFQAVKETAGQVLRYKGQTVAAFYVAGSKQSPPACKGVNDVATEKYVTYNEGLSGNSIHQTTLGWVNAGNYRNRGCMSQWGSRCLESAGHDYLKILRFYYGEDIGLETADGSCVAPPQPTLDAQYVDQGSSAALDETGQAYFKVCAGAPVQFWFELRNTGTASWVDWGDGGNALGQRVRLGVPGDKPDPLTGVTRISLNDATNPDVHPPSWDPPGPDCNDQAFCQRTVFSKNGGISATAPATPGIYKTEWQLVDEGRAWFGPGMFLTFRVESCGPPPGGTGGSGGSGAAGNGAAGSENGAAGNGSAGADPGSAGGPAQAGSGGSSISGTSGQAGAGASAGGTGSAGAAGSQGGEEAGGATSKPKGSLNTSAQVDSGEQEGCSVGLPGRPLAEKPGGWLLLLGAGWRAARRRRKKGS